MARTWRGHRPTCVELERIVAQRSAQPQSPATSPGPAAGVAVDAARLRAGCGAADPSRRPASSRHHALRCRPSHARTAGSARRSRSQASPSRSSAWCCCSSWPRRRGSCARSSGSPREPSWPARWSAPDGWLNRRPGGRVGAIALAATGIAAAYIDVIAVTTIYGWVSGTRRSGHRGHRRRRWPDAGAALGLRASRPAGPGAADRARARRGRRNHPAARRLHAGVVRRVAARAARQGLDRPCTLRAWPSARCPCSSHWRGSRSASRPCWPLRAGIAAALAHRQRADPAAPQKNAVGDGAAERGGNAAGAGSVAGRRPGDVAALMAAVLAAVLLGIVLVGRSPADGHRPRARSLVGAGGGLGAHRRHGRIRRAGRRPRAARDGGGRRRGWSRQRGRAMVRHRIRRRRRRGLPRLRSADARWSGPRR